MTEKTILDLYRKMGLGTQVQRNRLLRWVPTESHVDETSQTFIIETRNTRSLEEAQDAELARDSQ